mgnify:CR=1 FL=1
MGAPRHSHYYVRFSICVAFAAAVAFAAGCSALRARFQEVEVAVGHTTADGTVIHKRLPASRKLLERSITSHPVLLGGLSPAALSTPLVHQWQWLPSNNTMVIVDVIPDTVADAIYVLSVNEDITNGNVHAFHSHTGLPLWTTPLSEIGCDTIYLNAFAMHLSGNRLVVICDYAGAINTATGTVAWRVAWNPNSDSAEWEGTVVDGIFYSAMQVADPGPTTFFAQRVSDGQILWNVPFGHQIYRIYVTSESVVAVANYFPGPSVAFAVATGAVLWNATTTSGFSGTCGGAGGQQRILQIVGSEGNAVQALDAVHGSITWTYNVPQPDFAIDCRGLGDASALLSTGASVTSLSCATGAAKWLFYGPAVNIDPPSSAYQFQFRAKVSGERIFSGYNFGDIAVIDPVNGTSAFNISWVCQSPFSTRRNFGCDYPYGDAPVASNEGLTIWTTQRRQWFDGEPFVNVPVVIDAVTGAVVAEWTEGFSSAPAARMTSHASLGVYWTDEIVTVLSLQ